MRPALLIAIVAGAAVLGGGVEAQRQAILLPQEITFTAPFRPGGPSGATLYGDPNKSGLYVTGLKFAAGQKNLPHWHQDERTVVVLTGTYYFAYGEKWDESALKAYPPGTFLTEPPNTAHYNWAKDGEVILQVTGYGPTSAVNIPQDK